VKFVLYMLVMGGIVGAVAQLLAPGRARFAASVVVGIVGSFVGGVLGWWLTAPDPTGHLRTGGMLGSILGAVLLVAIWRAVIHSRRTGWARPSRDPYSRSRHHLY